MEKEFLKQIETAERILVTSHISPDPDALTSVLLLGRTLKVNYPDKQVFMVLEEKPGENLNFLAGYEEVEFQPVLKALSEHKPDLLIILDANNYKRISRNDSQAVKELIESNRIKTAIIDHHEIDDRDKTDVFINTKRPAAVEEVYVVCFEQLKLKKPGDYAETTLLGILSDTQRHRFDHPGYRETYRIVSEMLDKGASIEKLEARLSHYNKDELLAISHLAKNISSSKDGYSYSYIDDNFYNEWLNAKKNSNDLKKGVELFTNTFIKNFERNNWGFVVYPDAAAGSGCWGVSLRSVSGTIDVSAIARALGGGGHKPAAGAKIKASNIVDALNIVQKAISTNLSSPND